jgi:hypothetical protein
MVLSIWVDSACSGGFAGRRASLLIYETVHCGLIRMNLMTRWKRLAVWAVELIAQSVLLIVPLFLIVRPSGSTTIGGGLALSLAILLYFCLTGYVLTTAISRFCWDKQQIWSYPAFNALLFWVHFEIYYHLFGGEILTRHYRALLVGCGMGITFLISMLGSSVLKHWNAGCPSYAKA